MVALTPFFKSLFRKGRKPVPRESPEALRSMFKARYRSFKALLNANNSTLQLMSGLEKALQSGHSFGMSFIRANCAAISVNVNTIIQNLNEIASNRYEGLRYVFREIENKINQILEEKKELRKGEWVIPLRAVDKNMADQVGSKMANLGEIMNRVNLPVPEGFVITASAYELFMKYNKLREEIDRRIQTVDLEDLERLHEASTDVQRLILRSPLPAELEKAILSAYRHLEEKTEKGINVSLRSSALSQDTQKGSFSGQYRSELNVSHESLTNVYKEILASKYSPQAITYRLNMGFRDEDIAMCVGCMAMVDAVASGVMYSRDPGNIRNNVVLINAVWGLGKLVGDGRVTPDLFVVSKKSPHEILKKEIKTKDQKFVCLPQEGISCIALAGKQREEAAIKDDQAISLAELAVRLEERYGTPQDIEWAVAKDGKIKILQSRPLKQLKGKIKALKEISNLKVEQPVILEGGVTVSPGAACGPAFLIDTAVDALRFPPGAVLIINQSLPQWAALLHRAVAVISDRGGISGHLATVSREFNIPALFGTLEATSKIENGTVITVDADGRRVYAGKVEALLKEAPLKRVNLMKGSPVYNTLEKALEHIVPLNLIDPDGNNFQPKGCRTYHDITHFCHEKAVMEMFSFGEGHHFTERSIKQLVCKVPMQWWVIDLEDGFKEPIEGDRVTLSSIASIPMLAIWDGITAIPWEGPPPVDTKGFFSVMFSSTMDPSLTEMGRSRYKEKNYFMISKHFCNLTSRLGYHFSTVETFLTERPKDNYISFTFKGGAADYNRRVRRIKFIENILKKFDFRVKVNGDCIMARIVGHDQAFMIERLKVLGYLTIHTRQLDMIMANEAMVSHYMSKMLKDIYSFVSKPA